MNDSAPPPPAPQPSPGVRGLAPFAIARAATPTDLRLDTNEGPPTPADAVSHLPAAMPDLLRRYPDTSALHALLAARLGVAPDRVTLTAGADGGLDRVCRALLGPGREAVFPTPSFEMIPRYVQLAGGTLVTVPWERGPFPLDDVIAAITPRTSVVMMVSPNNPTGAAATTDDLHRLAAAAPHAVICLDAAYEEFADEPLAAVALALTNVVMLRTLSKAWGMAGLRIGYAVGAPDIIRWMRCGGAIFDVPRPSAAIAIARIEHCGEAMQAYVDRVRDERRELYALLDHLRVDAWPSQANFVLARFRDPLWIRDAMAGLGIAVRAYPGRDDMRGFVRTTCPGDEAEFARLCDAFQTILSPAAIFFDMDGVLAEAARSFRAAAIETAARYGVTMTQADITDAKAAGDANNDWVLTQRFLASRGVARPLDEVTAIFEEYYQGTATRPGFWQNERLLVDRDLLGRLAARLPLAVVTGRARADAERFLDTHQLGGYFSAVVCMEDGPMKPDPAPVRAAMALLRARHAWMIGDTPDDMRAARGAHALPLGIVAPHETAERMAPALFGAGAGRVIGSLAELETLLP